MARAEELASSDVDLMIIAVGQRSAHVSLGSEVSIPVRRKSEAHDGLGHEPPRG
jgi:hypothetical protein